MFGHRTPVKRVSGAGSQVSPQMTEVSRPSPPRPTIAPTNVRRSIGEWEEAGSKYPNRVAEARACLNKAKLHLSASRNLKTEIKAGVLSAIDRLFELVKEAEKEKGKPQPGPVTKPPTMDGACQTNLDPSPTNRSAAAPEAAELLQALKDHSLLVRECNDKVGGLKDTIDRQCDQQMTAPQANATAHVPVWAPAQPQHKPVPTHSVIVSSTEVMDTSDGVIGRIRKALDARTTGLQVQRVRKVRDQRVVLTCGSKSDLEEMKKKLSSDADLRVENAPTKRPLVVIKDVLSYNSDEDIIASLRMQNAAVLGDLTEEEFAATVKYRRRARNPHECHVVLQVSPKLWQRVTAAGKVYIDLQRVTVLDQTPLIQCTRCLGYGHGRKLCKEAADSCSHCGDLHLRAACPKFAAGEAASCKNCKLAKDPAVNHNAFDGDCPIHRKWDAIARCSIAYC